MSARRLARCMIHCAALRSIPCLVHRPGCRTVRCPAGSLVHCLAGCPARYFVHCPVHCRVRCPVGSLAYRPVRCPVRCLTRGEHRKTVVSTGFPKTVQVIHNGRYRPQSTISAQTRWHITDRQNQDRPPAVTACGPSVQVWLRHVTASAGPRTARSWTQTCLVRSGRIWPGGGVGRQAGRSGSMWSRASGHGGHNHKLKDFSARNISAEIVCAGSNAWRPYL
jgi:hypothetical protein